MNTEELSRKIAEAHCSSEMPPSNVPVERRREMLLEWRFWWKTDLVETLDCIPPRSYAIDSKPITDPAVSMRLLGEICERDDIRTVEVAQQGRKYTCVAHFQTWRGSLGQHDHDTKEEAIARLWCQVFGK